jgi:hypothetical protein
MSGPPRIVTVTRPTDYETLLGRHGTHAQARFFVESRGGSIDDAAERHKRREEALAALTRAIPVRWRRSRIDRADLSRFLFEPEDVVVVVGPDGLVANVAKYLEGQTVLGVNPDPGRYDGVLVHHAPQAVRDILPAVAAGRWPLSRHTMVEAVLDDGQRLLALNEVFLGHTTHQSARYRLRWRGYEERQSSSGLIVATGTGATGWARSIERQRKQELALPRPDEAGLAFFAREVFPSVATGTSLEAGRLAEGDALEIISEMDDAGTVFGDGIEDDRLTFPWGMRARVGVAARRLLLAA